MLQVLIWNETVANLTLMALGSSAPEILLAVIVTSLNLGNPDANDDLGTFTIIGSAAFNLLLITAVCIISVPSPDTKKIKVRIVPLPISVGLSKANLQAANGRSQMTSCYHSSLMYVVVCVCRNLVTLMFDLCN